MGCGCHKNAPRSGILRTSKEKDLLSGKNIIDKHSNQYLLISPIYDVYKDIIGYIAKSRTEETVKIFRKNIIKILD